jgi:Tfp pilus assembly protein PilV
MTLAELLVAMTVAVVGGIWLLASYHSILHLTEVSQQSATALDDLKDMMERIKATPFAQLTATFPTGVAGAYNGIVGGYTLSNQQITVTHQPSANADPRELVVQVTWTNRNRNYQRSLSTMRASRAS